MLTPAQWDFASQGSSRRVEEGREVAYDVGRGKWRTVRRRRAAVLALSISHFPHICPCRGRAIASAKLCGTLDEENNNWGTLTCELAKWIVLVSTESWACGHCASFKGKHSCQDYRTDCNNHPVCLKMASASSIAASIASKTKTKKKHFVAQKVKLFRASDPLLSVVMWGVNHSVSQTVKCPYDVTQ